VLGPERAANHRRIPSKNAFVQTLFHFLENFAAETALSLFRVIQ
jgi:hypothetical protein